MESQKIIYHPNGDGNQFSDVQTELQASAAGPASGSSTDKAVARWDGTTGRLLQDTPQVTVDATGELQVSITTKGTSFQEYFRAKPTDWGTGKPYLTIQDGDAATVWAISVFDGVTNNGTINFVASTGLTWNNVQIATLNTNTWLQQQGFARASLTDASPIAWNLQTQQSAYVLLTASVGATRQLQNPTNMVAGFTYILMVQQSSTGSNALTYGGDYKWPNGVAPVLSTANNAIDILTFVSDGSLMYGVAQKAFG